VGFFAISMGFATESPESSVASPERDAIIEKLKAKKLNVSALTHEMDGMATGINLGLGPFGDRESNANDETLALVAQLPEIESVYLTGGKFSTEGLARLARLPNLRWLDIYGSDIDPKAFAVLPKLAKLETLRIQE